MSWSLALSLGQIIGQVNAAAPNRSKASDGTIGNAAHAARRSDHNPATLDGIPEIVSAADITHDPANGADMRVVFESLRQSQDPRIKYVIFNDQFFSSYSTSTRKAWEVADYTGSNLHLTHLHISVLGTSRLLFNSRAAWSIGLVSTTPAPAPTKEISSMLPVLNLSRVTADSTTWLRSPQNHIKILQGLLIAHGRLAARTPDGVAGPATRSAVVTFQTIAGLTADGIVGSNTWRALLQI